MGSWRTHVTKLLQQSYGHYSQIESPSLYSGDQLLSIMDDVVTSGVVFVASIMPTELNFSDTSTTIARDIANVLNKLATEGVEVWLRLHPRYTGTLLRPVGRSIREAVSRIPGTFPPSRHMF